MFMIAYVKGNIAYIDMQSVVIDVGGVGYMVHVSANTIGALPPTGDIVQLFTYLQTSENTGQTLYGFLTREEVKMFSLLISVSGIGAKVATAILGTLSPADIAMSVTAEDVVALSKAPGVGKKTAHRLLLELKDKIATDDTWGATGIVTNNSSFASSEKQDAILALLTLGYERTEATQAVLEVAELDMESGAIIRLALKKLMR